MKLARCCPELKTLTNTVSVLFLILNNMTICLMLMTETFTLPAGIRIIQ